MKKLLLALCLLAALAANVHGGEWLRIDIIICEDPPAVIEFTGLVIEVAVWDEADPGGMIFDIVNPALNYDLVFCDNYLPGLIDVWNCAILPGKKRTHGYDGKWYQIRWMEVAEYDNDVSNFSTMHPDFEWRIDPDQSDKPDENSPIRLFQWQGAW